MSEAAAGLMLGLVIALAAIVVAQEVRIAAAVRRADEARRAEDEARRQLARLQLAVDRYRDSVRRSRHVTADADIASAAQELDALEVQDGAVRG
jgi:beta-lactamase regulating signal transducer with metallopeptidase domain